MHSSTYYHGLTSDQRSRSPGISFLPRKTTLMPGCAVPIGIVKDTGGCGAISAY